MPRRRIQSSTLTVLMPAYITSAVIPSMRHMPAVARTMRLGSAEVAAVAVMAMSSALTASMSRACWTLYLRTEKRDIPNASSELGWFRVAMVSS